MTINVDLAPVADEQEALVLMLHHLKLAASYFEATPDPLPDGFADGHFSETAMLVWAGEMERLYPTEDGDDA